METFKKKCIRIHHEIFGPRRSVLGLCPPTGQVSNKQLRWQLAAAKQTDITREPALRGLPTTLKLT